MMLVRNLLLLLFFLGIFTACTDKDLTASELRDLPNAKTRYITLKTVAPASDDPVLKSFEQALQKDQFTFTKEVNSKRGQSSFSNCDNNTILSLKGDGIVQYYADSTVPINGNFYPRFVLTIFTFDNEKIAAENHRMIEDALGTSSNEAKCNGKATDTLMLRDNKIYYFFTGADMLETYTVKYANFIKNFKP